MQSTFWWFIPLVFTIFSFAYAYLSQEEVRGIMDFINPIMNTFVFLCASVISLFVWLVYLIIFYGGVLK